MEDDVASALISLAVQLAFEVRRRRRVCVHVCDESPVPRQVSTSTAVRCVVGLSRTCDVM